MASISGTQMGRANCPFYSKVGACRHGDQCSRLHPKPLISPTLLLSNMYQRLDTISPGVDARGNPIDPRKIQRHFEEFYEDIFEEMSKYGEIESLNVCDNLGDHMVGNVYVQYREEGQAANALRNLRDRYYGGLLIRVDFSTVTDFIVAACRRYEENMCNFGPYCNFMHLKRISWSRLFRTRSHSPDRHRNYEQRSYGRHGHSRRYDDRDAYHESRSRRSRSTSPGRRRSRSRSLRGRRNRSPVREGSGERRARFEQWNREGGQQANHNNANFDGSKSSH